MRELTGNAARWFVMETADLLGTTRWAEARSDVIAGNNGYLHNHV